MFLFHLRAAYNNNNNNNNYYYYYYLAYINTSTSTAPPPPPPPTPPPPPPPPPTHVSICFLPPFSFHSFQLIFCCNVANIAPRPSAGHVAEFSNFNPPCPLPPPPPLPKSWLRPWPTLYPNIDFTVYL